MRCSRWKVVLMMMALAAGLLWGPQQAGRAQSRRRCGRLRETPLAPARTAAGRAAGRLFAHRGRRCTPRNALSATASSSTTGRPACTAAAWGPGYTANSSTCRITTRPPTRSAPPATRRSAEQIPHVKEGSEYRANEAFDPELAAGGAGLRRLPRAAAPALRPPRRPELPARRPPSSRCRTAVSRPRRRSSVLNSASRAISSPRAPSPSTASCWKTPLPSGRPALTPRKACSARAATCRTAATCGAASRTRTWCGRR